MSTSTRITTIDIFRALTMLMMLFVNDFAGMSNIPHFLEHAKMTEDMLGFSDLVFPAFLFCVGLSIPFSIANRRKKGDSDAQIILHIIERSVFLIIMGIFSMNGRTVEGGIPRYAISIAVVVAYFLLWNAYPKADGARKWLFKGLQILGAALLIGIVIYKDVNGIHFTHSWWGILGLIGWAYGICALTYVFLKGKFRNVLAAWIVVTVLCILNTLPCIPKEYSLRALFLSFYPGGWTHPAFVMAGAFASTALVKYAGKDYKKSWYPLMMLCIGAIMFVFGLASHQVWIISKIQATPAWLFYSLAIFFPLLALLYYLCDIKQHTKWAALIKPAGVATLTAYMLPSIWYALMSAFGVSYPSVFCSGGLGLLRSFVFAHVIIGLTWCLGKAKIKLKL
ncbi:MAG: DUF5009 domain-containing protein [Bacteroidales bacterium]|nr:DUF5009 domain-containing protein [Candidatus Cacconaster merdequi]